MLTSGFDEIKRWESVPNRREPFTLEMLADMTAHSAVAGCGEDSLQVTLADWFECGLFAGLRLSEWAQEAQHSSMDSSYMLDFKKQARMFRLGDISFESNICARYSAVEDVGPACAGIQITRCWITFRTQKTARAVKSACLRSTLAVESVSCRRCCASSDASFAFAVQAMLPRLLHSIKMGAVSNPSLSHQSTSKRRCETWQRACITLTPKRTRLHSSSGPHTRCELERV